MVIKSINRIRSIALGALGACALVTVLAAAAPAAQIFEQGPNYTVIGYDAGFDLNSNFVAGMVVLRVEYPVIVSGQVKVLTTLVDVQLAPGFTYVVKKAGGYDAPVEVNLQSANCSARFKALYKPGSTVVDGGALNCR